MLVLNIFMYIWLSLVCCMCTRLCYEEHMERHPSTRWNCSYIKRKCCFWKYKPIIQESELVESFHDVEQNQNDEPPSWVHQ